MRQTRPFPLLGLLVGLLLAAAASLPVTAGDAPARPNVLLVTLDTTRADYLSSYGFPLPTSPHLDALARDSVIFERALARTENPNAGHSSKSRLRR